MAGHCRAEFSDFMLRFAWLSPEDRRFLSRLIVELGRLDWTADGVTIDERILAITREIAPERIAWVADRLFGRGRAAPRADSPAPARTPRLTVLRS